MAKIEFVFIISLVISTICFGNIRGQRLNIEARLDRINEEFLNDVNWRGVVDLIGRLESYKRQFLRYDIDQSGDINVMEVKNMMEMLGQAKTYLEIKKIIAEVDTENNGTIGYREFVTMMLGNRSTILKIILRFEELRRER